MKKKKLIILTGAGISAESGIKTFRDHNGLWENHDIMEVASPEGFLKNPNLVLRFYNDRRKQLKEVTPNACHLYLKTLEKDYDVRIITQNVDDLHERAKSNNILHLHGELRKARSTQNQRYVIHKEGDINLGDLCPDGYQLRPHIVWFGEAVPNMDEAETICKDADACIIIGTSMQVYPAAGLCSILPQTTPILYVDPNPAIIHGISKERFDVVNLKAVESISKIKAWLESLTLF